MSLRPILKLAYQVARSNFCELSLPYRMTYAVTSRCQASCNMCGIWRRPSGNELTIAEIDSLFSRANHFSWINLTGGEIFQRPDIRDVLHAIIRQSRNLYLLNFPTNGFLTEEIIPAVDSILKQTSLPRLIISVSLDGPRELHDRIRNLPGSWDRALETFRQLRERRSRRFSVYLGHTLQAANLGSFDKTLEACRAEVGDITEDDFHINIAHVSKHYYGNEHFESTPDPLMASEQLEKFYKRRSYKPFNAVAFVERRYQHLAQLYLKEGAVPLACQAAAASCYIDPEGNVYPCTGFDISMGSLRENNMDIFRIWRSEERRNVRRSVCAGDCPRCWTPCEAYQTILANLTK